MPEPVTEPGDVAPRDEVAQNRLPAEGTRLEPFPRPRWNAVLGAGLLVLLLLVGVPSGAVGASASGAGLSAHPVALPGGLAPLANGAGPVPIGAVAVSAVPAASAFTFNVEIAIPTTPAEQAFQTGLLTPGSPYYHQFTPRGYAFVNAWGPSPTTVSALRSYFAAYGLHVTPLDQLGLLYGVSGSVGQVDAALHTQLWHYTAAGATGIAPSSVPYLPSSLAPWVEGFHLLNSFANPRPMYQVASPSIAHAAMGPSQLEGAYSAATLISGGDTGSQYTIGLAELCDPSQASTTYQTDVNAFDSANSFTADTVTTSGSGASTCSGGSSGWGVETDLDVQSSHSLAPGASQNVCLDNSDPSICDSSFISGGIEFGSNSWGSTGNTFASVWNTAEASGVDLLASAGDSCAGLSGSSNGVSYPAAEEYGVSVGGTTLSVSGTSWSGETVWGTGCTSPGAGGGSGGGTGGGCDPTTTSPPYQSGTPGYPGACSSGNRGYPDVAADADPASGINVYIQNAATNCGGMDPCQIGGTSLACPLWAASLDLIYQASGFTGYATGKLYTIAQSSSYTTNFHDITSGSNGYSATTGWDPATGVGSPIIGSLVTGFNSPLVATLTPTTSTVETGQPVTLTTQAGGGAPGYTYQWQQNGTAIAGAPNRAVYNYTQFHSSPSPYLVSVVVTDTKGATVTAGPASITVTPGPAVSFTANRSKVDAGQSISLTATPSAGSGTYPVFDWTLNGTTFSTGSTSTATWTAPNHSFTATLGVQVFDSLGGSAVASSPVQVFAAPGVLLSLSNAGPVDVLSTIVLVATGTGGATPHTYTFLLNGTTTLQSGTGSVYNWTPQGAGTYTLSVGMTDALGLSASSTVHTIVVNADPFVSLSLPNGVAAVDTGALVSVRAQAGGGTAPLSYSWTMNSAPVVGATTANLQFKAPAPGTVTLTVSVTDNLGRSATAGPISIQVNADPTVRIQGGTSVVVGATEGLTATVTGGTTPFRFLWTGTTDAATDNSPISNFSSSNTGTFPVTVVASDSGGGAVSAVINITVSAAPAWYDTPFIPGTTSATLSWALLLGIVVAAVVLIVVVRRKRKAKAGAPPAPPPPGSWSPAGPAMAGMSHCGACGSPNAYGAPFCGSCGNPLGGGPPPTFVPSPYAGPPPGYGGYSPPPPPPT